ncbi:hypothetical protein FACS1894217_15590 [Clostridia bacterium]|nr:hypothetical protein FACS1894217_15590 [Clostridia bacterium]
MNGKPKLLTIKEAAKTIDGLTEFRVRQMCVSGALPCFKAGRKYLISEQNLLRAVGCADSVNQNAGRAAV